MHLILDQNPSRAFVKHIYPKGIARLPAGILLIIILNFNDMNNNKLETKNTQIETGEFGPIYRQFEGKPQRLWFITYY